MKIFSKVVGTVVAVTASSAALAQEASTPLDFTSLTSSIDVSSVVSGIMAVAAVMVGVHLAWKGVQFIMRAVKGA
ncbi:hypothetical protein [Achromobacter denitrificans]|uniref:hypothetical protein n=1 Tax=Achromobacter denitrificans TaxID=32002 RepID=UPI000B48C640|nr:hypothetical protein [Achromobacter denitrificans]